MSLICPVCSRRYPDDRTTCEDDGEALVGGHSMDISFGGTERGTSAESPGGRQRHSSGGGAEPTVNDAGTRVSSGVYFYKLQTKGFTKTKKMVLLK